MDINTIISVIGGGGLIGLLVLLWKIKSQREAVKREKALNRPRLEIFRRMDKEGNPEIWLSNQGTGTAIITEFNLVIDNNELPGDTGDSYIQALQTLNIGSRIDAFITGPNKHIVAGKEWYLLKFEPEDIADVKYEVAERLKERFKYKIRYKSELGEEFDITK